IAGSRFGLEIFKDYHNKQELLDMLKKEDREAVGVLSRSSMLCAGLALFSLFAALEAAKPIWMSDTSKYDSWAWARLGMKTAFAGLI
ncbi:hypothetical protein ABTD78_21670, partial [Acinetobacter baumannii]